MCNNKVLEETKLLRIKLLKTLQILSSCELFPYAGIKKRRDEEMSKCNMKPS